MDSKDVIIRKYLAEIGRLGGKKSRRRLTTAQSKEMLLVREARRAYLKFHASCFWSFDEDYKIRISDVPWVVEELRKNGNRAAWEAAERLCH